MSDSPSPSPSPSATSVVCARFHRAIELIGSRWTGAILQTLLQGRCRYAAIKAAIPEITDRMLSERLRSLESEGLVERAVIPESPVRVEYELTTKGRELQSALREIGSWAERWIPLDENADTSNTTESNSGNLPANRRPRKKAASA
jgi:DNA-binding HxlR family transcriptional regulator